MLGSTVSLIAPTLAHTPSFAVAQRVRIALPALGVFSGRTLLYSPSQLSHLFRNWSKHSALGNKCGDEVARCDIKRIVCGRTIFWCQSNRAYIAVVGLATNMGQLFRCTLLDRNVAYAILDRPVNSRNRQRDIERDAIVACSQCLKVGTNLVGNVAARGCPVAANNTEVDQPMLHQMSAGVVYNQGMWDPVVTQLPSRQRSALIAWASFVHPNMDWYTGIEGLVNRSEGGAPIDRCQPTRVAMSENIDRTRS